MGRPVEQVVLVIQPQDRTTQHMRITTTTQGQHGMAVETHTQPIFPTFTIRTTTLMGTSTRIITLFGLGMMLYTHQPMLTATTLSTTQQQSLLITSHIVEA